MRERERGGGGAKNEKMTNDKPTKKLLTLYLLRRLVGGPSTTKPWITRAL